MKAKLIVSDPCWSFSDKLTMSDVKRGALANYSTMTMKDIKELPVNEIADPSGAILALWVPSSLLQDGLDAMNAYGFKCKQTFIWNKIKSNKFTAFKKWIKKSASKLPIDKISKAIIEAVDQVDLNDQLAFGMGRLFRNTHEICLIGTNNNNIYQSLMNRSQRTVCFAPNLKHSAKPEHLQNSLELMFPGDNVKKVELFARRERKGWTCLGNESVLTPNEDIRVSLKKLIKFEGDALKLTSEDWKALEY